MGLATNISFADDAYPAMFLGKRLEGMRGIQMSRVENQPRRLKPTNGVAVAFRVLIEP